MQENGTTRNENAPSASFLAKYGSQSKGTNDPLKELAIKLNKEVFSKCEKIESKSTKPEFAGKMVSPYNAQYIPAQSTDKGTLAAKVTINDSINNVSVSLSIGGKNNENRYVEITDWKKDVDGNARTSSGTAPFKQYVKNPADAMSMIQSDEIRKAVVDFKKFNSPLYKLCVDANMSFSKADKRISRAKDADPEIPVNNAYAVFTFNKSGNPEVTIRNHDDETVVSCFMDKNGKHCVSVADLSINAEMEERKEGESAFKYFINSPNDLEGIKLPEIRDAISSFKNFDSVLAKVAIEANKYFSENGSKRESFSKNPEMQGKMVNVAVAEHVPADEHHGEQAVIRYDKIQITMFVSSEGKQGAELADFEFNAQGQERQEKEAPFKVRLDSSNIDNYVKLPEVAFILNSFVETAPQKEPEFYNKSEYKNIENKCSVTADPDTIKKMIEGAEKQGVTATAVIYEKSGTLTFDKVKNPDFMNRVEDFVSKYNQLKSEQIASGIKTKLATIKTEIEDKGKNNIPKDGQER